jgi:hypothetical protein
VTELYRLAPRGRRIVEESDFPEETTDLPTDDLVELTHSVEGSVDYETLDDAIETTVDLFDRDVPGDRSAMDSNLAPTVRETVDITPRVAARPGVWHYLTLFQYPEFVQYRYGFSDETDLREKYLGDQNDLYSNAFARLWWGAHLTSCARSRNYFATHKMFNKQRLANYVLDSSFRRYHPAAVAFAEELYEETGEDITAIASRFNRARSTYLVEARSKTTIRSQIRRIRDHET